MFLERIKKIKEEMDLNKANNETAKTQLVSFLNQLPNNKIVKTENKLIGRIVILTRGGIKDNEIFGIIDTANEQMKCDMKIKSGSTPEILVSTMDDGLDFVGIIDFLNNEENEITCHDSWGYTMELRSFEKILKIEPKV